MVREGEGRLLAKKNHVCTAALAASRRAAHAGAAHIFCGSVEGVLLHQRVLHLPQIAVEVLGLGCRGGGGGRGAKTHRQHTALCAVLSWESLPVHESPPRSTVRVKRCAARPPPQEEEPQQPHASEPSRGEERAAREGAPSTSLCPAAAPHLVHPPQRARLALKGKVGEVTAVCLHVSKVLLGGWGGVGWVWRVCVCEGGWKGGGRGGRARGGRVHDG